MVDLGSKSPYGQSFDNSVFIIPGLVIIFVVAFCGMKLYKSIQDKDQKSADRKARREEKKNKKTN